MSRSHTWARCCALMVALALFTPACGELDGIVNGRGGPDGRGPGRDGPDGPGGPGGSGAMAPAPAVSDAIFALGQALFFDKLLSGSEELSCATCHHPGLGTDDDLALSHGIDGEGLGATRQGGAIIPRNAPALFNLHLYETMFWDSRVLRRQDGSLETPAGAQLTPAMEQTFTFGIVAAQAMFPVTSREEMRGLAGDNELADLADDDFTGIWSGLMARIGEFPDYVNMFEAAYPGERFADMTFAHAANAIAGYEIRAFEKTNTRFQRFLAGEEDALSPLEDRGRRDFFSSGCDDCHQGPLLSDFRHHNTGLAQFGPGKGHGPSGRDDFGREGVTGNAQDRYAFRTTPLVNLSMTGPFGHAGQFATLRDFVAHYRNPEQNLRNYDIREEVDQSELWDMRLDNVDEVLGGLDRDMNLGRFDVDAVTAFLEAATDDQAFELAGTIPSSVPSGHSVER